MEKGRELVLSCSPSPFPSQEKEQRSRVRSSKAYRSISSRSGVASPAMDMGVLSIMGLGDGRGVSLCFCFLRSASFSWSHCSAIFPQSIAAWLLDFGCCLCLELDDGCDCVDWGVVLAWS